MAINFNLLDTNNYDPDKFISDIEGWLVELCRATIHYFDQDSLQIARLAAIEAMETFDPKKGCQLHVWIWKLVVNNLNTYLLDEYYRGKAKFRRSCYNIHPISNEDNEEITDKSFYAIDDKVSQPFDELLVEEFKDVVTELINIYVKHRNIGKTTHKILMSYFVDNMDVSIIARDYGAKSKSRGKRLDNRLRNFAGWMKIYCKRYDINIKPYEHPSRNEIRVKRRYLRNNEVQRILRQNEKV
jgi:hypothetical protein